MDVGSGPRMHGDDETPVAPGELELVRAFLSLHDHRPGDDANLPPSAKSLEDWFRLKGLIDDHEIVSPGDLRLSDDVARALRARLDGGEREPAGDASEQLDKIADEAGLRVSFKSAGTEEKVGLTTARQGVMGALARLLGIVFLAELDGSWQHLKRCSNPTCTSVFFDHSKNHSGKWCTMATCGNRAKVRAFRQRRAANE